MMTQKEVGQIAAWVIVLVLVAYAVAAELLGAGTPPAP